MISLDPAATALILIDLQKGILAHALAPHPAADVFARGTRLAGRLRDAGGTVVRVRVAWSAGFADAPSARVDEPMSLPPGGVPPEWSEFPDDPAAAGDLVVTKRHWGAFHGTELDLQLRRRGVRTVVLGGIATNYGVESTARSAWEHGYDVVVVEDACASRSAELHAFPFRHVFPRIARVAVADAIEFAR